MNDRPFGTQIAYGEVAFEQTRCRLTWLIL